MHATDEPLPQAFGDGRPKVALKSSIQVGDIDRILPPTALLRGRAEHSSQSKISMRMVTQSSMLRVPLYQRGGEYAAGREAKKAIDPLQVQAAEFALKGSQSEA